MKVMIFKQYFSQAKLIKYHINKIKKTMCHHMSKIFKGFLNTVRNSKRISKVLKGVVCWHLFLGCRKIHSEEFSAQKIVFYNFLVFKNLKFLTCSEIEYKQNTTS